MHSCIHIYLAAVHGTTVLTFVGDIFVMMVPLVPTELNSLSFQMNHFSSHIETSNWSVKFNGSLMPWLGPDCNPLTPEQLQSNSSKKVRCVRGLWSHSSTCPLPRTDSTWRIARPVANVNHPTPGDTKSNFRSMAGLGRALPSHSLANCYLALTAVPKDM